MVVHLPGLFEEAEKNEKKGRSVSRRSRPAGPTGPAHTRSLRASRQSGGPRLWLQATASMSQAGFRDTGAGDTKSCRLRLPRTEPWSPDFDPDVPRQDGWADIPAGKGWPLGTGPGKEAGSQ